MAELEIKRAGGLERVCVKLAELFYPELIGEVEFLVLMRSESFPGSPRTVARIEKLSGVKAWLYRQYDGVPSPIFKIEIVESKFDRQTPEAKIAILDHEIAHIEVSELTGEPTVSKDHDIEEFGSIVRRHGNYHDGLAIFAEALEQGIESESTREEIKRQILESDESIKL